MRIDRASRIEAKFLVLLFAALCLEAVATPPKAYWSREIPIGVGGEKLFTLRVERVLPGSYYSYTEASYWCTYALPSGDLEEKVLLSKTDFTQPDAKPPWRHTSENADEKHVSGVVQAWPRTLLFPFALSEGIRLEVSRDGLFAVGGQTRTPICDQENLDRHVRPPTHGWATWREDRASVSGLYTTRIPNAENEEASFYIIVIQYGTGQGVDEDCYQSVLPVPQSSFDKVIAELVKRSPDQ